jgi:hypothetical protein
MIFAEGVKKLLHTAFGKYQFHALRPGCKALKFGRGVVHNILP